MSTGAVRSTGGQKSEWVYTPPKVHMHIVLEETAPTTPFIPSTLRTLLPQNQRKINGFLLVTAVTQVPQMCGIISRYEHTLYASNFTALSAYVVYSDNSPAYLLREGHLSQ